MKLNSIKMFVNGELCTSVHVFLVRIHLMCEIPFFVKKRQVKIPWEVTGSFYCD